MVCLVGQRVSVNLWFDPTQEKWSFFLFIYYENITLDSSRGTPCVSDITYSEIQTEY